MMWLALSLALIFSALALLYVMWPFFKSGPAPIFIENDQLAELVAQKDATLVAIKELEFDYRVGKLSDDDYRRFDQRLRRQAINLMQQIEQIAPESSALEMQLEEEIRRRRKALSRADGLAATDPTPPPQPGMATERGGADGRRFCTNCGARLEPHHRFCGVCGAAVAHIHQPTA